MDKDRSVFRKMDVGGLNEYLSEVYSLKAKIELMDMKIREIAELEIIKDKVDKLVCFSGIDVTTAVETVVEIHDFLQDLQWQHSL